MFESVIYFVSIAGALVGIAGAIVNVAEDHHDGLAHQFQDIDVRLVKCESNLVVFANEIYIIALKNSKTVPISGQIFDCNVKLETVWLFAQKRLTKTKDNLVTWPKLFAALRPWVPD